MFWGGILSNKKWRRMEDGMVAAGAGRRFWGILLEMQRDLGEHEEVVHESCL